MLKMYSIGIPPEAASLWRMYTRYGWHQALLRFFGDSNPSTLLWRARRHTNYGGSCIVLTDGEICNTASLRLQVQSKPFPMDFLQGKLYRFNVECSPRYCEFSTGRKLPVERDECEEWFERRTTDWGFRVEQLNLLNWDMNHFYRRGNCIHLPEAEFSGTLHVVDRQKFIQAATRGIGGKYTFGFGLLQLSRTL